MHKVAEENGADLALISEQYRGNTPPRWFSDADSRAAICAFSPLLHITDVDSGSKSGWTWVEMDKVRIYSCYFSPNSIYTDFVEGLTRLGDSISASPLPTIVAGDFNAKAPEWGSPHTDRRGILLSEMASQLRLHAINTGSSTFVRGNSASVIDVTFKTKNKALEGWAVRKLDAPALEGAIALKRETVFNGISGRGAEEVTQSLNDLFRFACNASMPKLGSGVRRPPSVLVE
ncbi:uncharacterized protein LOC143917424 [Arctopsyche grandis]|uniref:uncharacterized protein LOC143917424 n=1 Tax=Arctopsyche grandis TaxID=121162 RepID=UPI00406D8114